jgi:hypothetical protein
MFRERSLATYEHLRKYSNRISYVLYLRVLAGLFVDISILLMDKSYNEDKIKHFEAFADCFNCVTAVIWMAVVTSNLSVMVGVRIESAINLKAIAMLVSNSPRTEPASLTIISSGK